jgi:hypothetical protein
MTVRPIYLAVFILVSAYVATTGIGAMIFTTDLGRGQLDIFLGRKIDYSEMPVIGSAFYWAMLASLIIISVPVALLTERGCTARFTFRKPIDIPTWIPVALGLGLVTFCFAKLAMAGGLSAHEAWDRSVCYGAKIERRAELIAVLGNRYYSFAYSSIPIVCSFLLAKAIMRSDRFALATFVVFSGALAWLYIAMIMKGPLIIYIGTVGFTMVLAGFGVLRSIGLVVPTAMLCYSVMSVMQYCDTATVETPKVIMVAATQPAPTPPSLDTGIPSIPKRVTDSLGFYVARNTLFRMASAFPFYLQRYSISENRCGLEVPASLVHRKCFPSSQIFDDVFPTMTHVQGNSPAPVNVSAYAELGPIYSVVATAICAVLIGFLSFLAKERTPLAVSIAVATCTYAYYVTQVGLTASLFDSYGLLWLLLPIIAMYASAVVLRRSQRKQHQSQSHRTKAPV